MKVSVTANIDREMQRALIYLSNTERRSVNQLLLEAIDDLFMKRALAGVRLPPAPTTGQGPAPRATLAARYTPRTGD